MNRVNDSKENITIVETRYNHAMLFDKSVQSLVSAFQPQTSRLAANDLSQHTLVSANYCILFYSIPRCIHVYSSQQAVKCPLSSCSKCPAHWCLQVYTTLTCFSTLVSDVGTRHTTLALSNQKYNYIVLVLHRVHF